MHLLSICTEIRNWKKNKKFKIFNNINGLSPNHYQGVQLNDIPVVEQLLKLKNHLYGSEFVDETLSVNLLDEKCKNMKILSVFCAETTMYALCVTLMLSSHLFPAQIVTPFQPRTHVEAKFNFMQ